MKLESFQAGSWRQRYQGSASDVDIDSLIFFFMINFL